MKKRGRGPRQIYKTGYGVAERRQSREDRAWDKVPKEYREVRSDRFGKPLRDLSKHELITVLTDHTKDKSDPYHNPDGETTRASSSAVAAWSEEERNDLNDGRGQRGQETKAQIIEERDEKLKDAAETYFRQPENWTKTLEEAADVLVKQPRFCKLSVKTIKDKIRGIKRNAVRSARSLARFGMS